MGYSDDYEKWGLRTELGIKDLINNTPKNLTGDTGGQFAPKEGRRVTSE